MLWKLTEPLSRVSVPSNSQLWLGCLMEISRFTTIEDFDSWCFIWLIEAYIVLDCRQLNYTVLCTKSLFVENAYAFRSIKYAWYCVFAIFHQAFSILSYLVLKVICLHLFVLSLHLYFPFVSACELYLSVNW